MLHIGAAPEWLPCHEVFAMEEPVFLKSMGCARTPGQRGVRSFDITCTPKDPLVHDSPTITTSLTY